MRCLVRLLRVSCAVVLTACAATPTPDAPALATSTTIAFVNAQVVPMTARDSVLPNQTVLVRDGRIAVIGPAATTEVPQRALRIDARGQYLMPGLVDAHVHLEYFDDPRVLDLFLANGITTVRNMDGRPYLLDWRRRIASKTLIGPTIYTAGPILDGDPPVRDDNTIVRNAVDARAAVAAQDSTGYDFVKVYTNLSPEAYRTVVSAARERHRSVAGHVPRQVSIEEVLSAGQHSLEHLTDFDELVEADSSSVRGRFHWSKLYLAMPADAQKMASAARRAFASNVWIVPTGIQADRAIAPPESVRAWLRSTEAQYIPNDAKAFWEELATRNVTRMDSADWRIVERGRANRRALIRALHEAGAKLAVGTDTPNPFLIPGFSVHDELAVFVAAGLSPREALVAATRASAQLLGSLGDFGTVEVGKRADLLLLRENPLANIISLRQPVGIMVRGNWLPAAQVEAMLQRFRLRNPIKSPRGNRRGPT